MLATFVEFLLGMLHGQTVITETIFFCDGIEN
jgi:ABC-type dipeptide/oligopeptide/nickel transport system permease component